MKSFLDVLGKQELPVIFAESAGSLFHDLLLTPLQFGINALVPGLIKRRCSSLAPILKEGSTPYIQGLSCGGALPLTPILKKKWGHEEG
ncbi:hypothetical protein DUNSADRAFT_7667 [Dunaliella salina]|uniref:Encoded protein n=1 Tax=Dunaliella salina TaxID=3046 RepID=A0ABQ7H678_DUNSA|nr:hypothetical protein DUNSADRAFT_7667 [Dunaliella salina]|eukprot:KAF5842353.1 hypothetical protein DUNSADRAFT_7667 [Dunaliella salina]